MSLLQPLGPDAAVPAALRLEGISKAYGPVRANVDVSLEIRPGIVHAILGENGAGKSTLMRVLYGVERPDAGHIHLAGQPVVFRSPHEAIRAGIGMVFQHFGLVSEFTSLDNIALGAEMGRSWAVDRRREQQRVSPIVAELGIEVSLDQPVTRMSAAQQQRVEILKALYRGARLLILDEPTALLTPQERQGLFAAIRKLRDDGVTIIFITHKLAEVLGLADEITVMRDGRIVATYPVSEADESRLVADMVGGALPPIPKRSGVQVGAEALALRGAHVLPTRASRGLRGVDLSIRSGEIVGLVGIDGHGHQELCRVLAGITPLSSGEVVTEGRTVRTWNRAAAQRAGVSYVPEDRLHAGVAGTLAVSESLVANRVSLRRLGRGMLLGRGEVRRTAAELIDAFDVRCRDADQVVQELSGGNIQKVVLAREISIGPRVLVVSEPTRGLDVGAISAVHRRLISAAEGGAAVVIQSSDLDEILTLVDRVVVCREGSVVAMLANDGGLDARVIGAAMLGATGPAA